MGMGELAGWYMGSDGWRSKYSQQRFIDDFEDLKGFFDGRENDGEGTVRIRFRGSDGGVLDVLVQRLFITDVMGREIHYKSGVWTVNRGDGNHVP